MTGFWKTVPNHTFLFIYIDHCHTNNIISDQICKNMHSSHIQFFNFEDPYNLLGMTDRLDTCRVYRATIPLSLVQISDLYMVPTRFSESLNEKIGCVNYAHFPKSSHRYYMEFY